MFQEVSSTTDTMRQYSIRHKQLPIYTELPLTLANTELFDLECLTIHTSQQIKLLIEIKDVFQFSTDSYSSCEV